MTQSAHTSEIHQPTLVRHPYFVIPHYIRSKINISEKVYTSFRIVTMMTIILSMKVSSKL